VRDAFTAKGHDVTSCDLLPTESPGKHYQGDIRDILNHNWDMMIAHPPCTHLAVSGARWFVNKRKEQVEALDFVRMLLNAPIQRIALENPVSIISSKVRKPDQSIQPYQFGHPETKRTCLWLKNLPLLKPTNIVEPDYMRKPNGDYYRDKKGRRYSRIHFMSRSSPDRWKERSRTYTGIANAMAAQWSF
jgi:site-specific DNA-cytosine methylase